MHFSVMGSSRRLLLTLGMVAVAIFETSDAGAQSQDLKDLRTTLELVFMCSVKNDSTSNVKEYFESTGDRTLQREWNGAIDRSQKQMQNAQKAGGQKAILAAQRYDLSCTLLDTTSNLPIGLQSAMHK